MIFQLINKISLSIFLSHIFLQFNTGYFEDGLIVINRKLIIKKYLRN